METYVSCEIKEYIEIMMEDNVSPNEETYIVLE
jgi:hypothetical protein